MPDEAPNDVFYKIKDGYEEKIMSEEEARIAIVDLYFSVFKDVSIDEMVDFEPRPLKRYRVN